MIVMTISDIMTLNFFYMVRDEGSWLDIGTTISHFCIASGVCTFVAGLELLSEAFISGVDFGHQQQQHAHEKEVNSVNGNSNGDGPDSESVEVSSSSSPSSIATDANSNSHPASKTNGTGESGRNGGVCGQHTTNNTKEGESISNGTVSGVIPIAAVGSTKN